MYIRVAYYCWAGRARKHVRRYSQWCIVVHSYLVIIIKHRVSVHVITTNGWVFCPMKRIVEYDLIKIQKKKIVSMINGKYSLFEYNIKRVGFEDLYRSFRIVYANIYYEDKTVPRRQTIAYQR